MASNSAAVLARLRPQVPTAMVERLSRSAGTVADPALAASVVLLREGPAGLETYLMQRHARMAFAPSVVVFPGGRVDPADLSASGGPVRACAVRETAEETGVVLDPADLLAWAHWITPEVEPRRYDTHFFLAALPQGARAEDISGETDHADWMAPAGALEAERRGALSLMPPTLSILLELADLPDLAAARAAAAGRVIETVLPRLEYAGGAWHFRYPSAGRASQP